MTATVFAFFRFLRAVFLGAVFFVPIALAEEPPEDLLITDFANCMQGCMDHESQIACEILCGCAMERFRSELDYDGYVTLSEQMGKNEISSESQAFLDETGAICVAELDRLMGEMGLAMPPEAAPAEDKEP